jgi:hypothetical protein
MVKYWAVRAKGIEQRAKSRKAKRRGSGEAGKRGSMGLNFLRFFYQIAYSFDQFH